MGAEKRARKRTPAAGKPEDKRHSEPSSSPPEGQGAGPKGPEVGTDLAPVVGHNLRELRMKRGLSLEKLSQKSGVSRAMLGQIELGQSAPTINVLWKVARALDVTFSTLIVAKDGGATTLLRAKDAKILTSLDGTFRSRALFPWDGPRRTEFYEPMHRAPWSISSSPRARFSSAWGRRRTHWTAATRSCSRPTCRTSTRTRAARNASCTWS
jgi:transcriptional regulator with XRE-family HTH domain